MLSNSLPILIIISFFCLTQNSTIYSQNNNFPENTEFIYQYDDEKIQTDARRIQGTTYKIELMRLPVFDKSDPALSNLTQYGEVSTEYWHNASVYVLLVGSFKELSKAKSIRTKIKNAGFPGAQIVTYEDGIRK